MSHFLTQFHGQTHIQWKLAITRSLGLGKFVCYIRYLVISVVNQQYKTKQINSDIGTRENSLVYQVFCYIRSGRSVELDIVFCIGYIIHMDMLIILCMIRVC